MTGKDDFPIHETRGADEAFQLFSHELRINILLALWNAPEFRLTFSELQDEVGERDSGKFNYHLSEIVGQYVGHDGDKYELLYPGHRVIDAIQSGMLHQSTEIESIELQAKCPNCDSSLEFQYMEYIATISCSHCEELVLEFAFDPAGIVDRTPEEVIGAFDKRTRYLWGLALKGICPICSGSVRVEPSSAAGKSSKIDHFGDNHPVVVSLDCQQCSFYSYPPIGMVLLDNPDLLGTLSEQNINVQEIPLWEIDFLIDPSCISIQSRDPWEIEISTTIGDEKQRVTLDNELAVRKVEEDISEIETKE